jgi:hypothetical protein
MQARGLRSIWLLSGTDGCMWDGQRQTPAARWVCLGQGVGGVLDWRRGMEGRLRGTCSRDQLKFLKDDLVLENSARSCRRPSTKELSRNFLRFNVLLFIAMRVFCDILKDLTDLFFINKANLVLNNLSIHLISV